jgi:hypothetical protein
MQDIDYAAVAVKTAIIEKFGRASALVGLDGVANNRIISIKHDRNYAEGARDKLLAAIRKSRQLAVPNIRLTDGSGRLVNIGSAKWVIKSCRANALILVNPGELVGVHAPDLPTRRGSRN